MSSSSQVAIDPTFSDDTDSKTAAGQAPDYECLRVHEERSHEEDIGKERLERLERKLVRKVDLRLCTIAGILCSLNLLDSGIISVRLFRLWFWRGLLDC
jgi:hypothetical protein